MACTQPPTGAGGADAGPDSGADAAWVAPGPDEGDPLILEGFEDRLGEYQVGEELGAWTVLRAEERAVVAEASARGVPSRRGDAVFYFSAFSDAPRFRESRLDRCVEFDATRPLDFGFDVYADVEAEFVSDDLRVRVNPNFYEDVETCREDVNEDSTGARLEEIGTWYNEDWDVRLESARAEPRAWFRARRATHNAPDDRMRYEPEDFPRGAGAVRFSLRIRDDLYSPATSRYLYLGSADLWQL